MTRCRSCYWVSPSSQCLFAWFPVTPPPTPPRLGFKWISHPTSAAPNQRHAKEAPVTIQVASASIRFPSQIDRWHFLFSARRFLKCCFMYWGFFLLRLKLFARVLPSDWVFYGLLIWRLRSRWLILPTVPSRCLLRVHVRPLLFDPFIASLGSETSAKRSCSRGRFKALSCVRLRSVNEVFCWVREVKTTSFTLEISSLEMAE